jgi:hypothetical protein
MTDQFGWCARRAQVALCGTRRPARRRQAWQRRYWRTGVGRLRVPDAVPREAAQISLRNLRKLDCAAKRCTAAPGPLYGGGWNGPGSAAHHFVLRCARDTCGSFLFAMDARVKPAHDGRGIRPPSSHHMRAWAERSAPKRLGRLEDAAAPPPPIISFIEIGASMSGSGSSNRPWSAAPAGRTSRLPRSGSTITPSHARGTP